MSLNHRVAEIAKFLVEEALKFGTNEALEFNADAIKKIYHMHSVASNKKFIEALAEIYAMDPYLAADGSLVWVIAEQGNGQYLLIPLPGLKINKLFHRS